MVYLLLHNLPNKQKESGSSEGLRHKAFVLQKIGRGPAACLVLEENLRI